MSEPRILRHRAADRLFHWIMAATVLVLLATGLLPQFGVRFDWVWWHWSTGLLLGVTILYHLVRVIVRGTLAAMRPDASDAAQLRALLGGPPALPGKYSLAQKAMHHAMALLILAAVVTGLLMMVKVDTPFWQRNPYWLAAGTWGGIYVVHGLAALCIVSAVMLHVYFALRPEKQCYRLAMLHGWMSRADWRAHHDPALWPQDAAPPAEPETTR
ncbi:MAG: cytochrome b/b6 domain-containing protein [Gammaproteobacteria bacterium]|nr:cytochrome b/b6 domain-containing protein [Gammaproteobacteria bacterium]